MNNSRNVIGYIASICIFTVILVDLIYGAVTNRETLLTWTQIAFAALAIFALFAHHITKFSISPKEGVTIEKQVDAFEEDLKRIEAISHNDSTNELESLLRESTSLDHSLWTRLIIYRLAMRALLRRLCNQQGMHLGDTQSMRSMLSMLSENGTIPANLNKDLQRIRYATFPAEWGTGTLPPRDEIKQIVENAPDILRQLHKLNLT